MSTQQAAGEWVRCPKCLGSVRLPAEAASTICCPNCREPVYKIDAETGAAWRPEPPPGTVSPQGWMLPTGWVAVILGGVGFAASFFVELQKPRSGLGSALFSGLLNPLFFVGVPLGVYWIKWADRRGGEDAEPRAAGLIDFSDPSLPKIVRDASKAPAGGETFWGVVLVGAVIVFVVFFMAVLARSIAVQR